MNATRASKWVMFAAAAAISTCPATEPPPGDDIYLNGFEQFTLTIDNILAWCSIQENGTSSYSPSAVFNQGTVVDVYAAPISGFIWGHWTGTDADSGSGDTSQIATVTMTSDRAVTACCPFPSGTGC